MMITPGRIFCPGYFNFTKNKQPLNKMENLDRRGGTVAQ